MKKGKIFTALMLVTAGIAATGCGAVSTNSAAIKTGDLQTEQNSIPEFITPDLSDDGTILVDTSILTAHPKYVNYDAGGTTVQMIAVKASDDSYRLSLNTCQSCNPSPRAYFKEKNGRLVCQNCGNTFTMDSVGSLSGGCNPMNIAYETTGDHLAVKKTDLNRYAEKFLSWKGPTE
ncbi:Fe-S-containing protein [[Clostridium] aminophilum]|uniref:Fe-S-containing protein n=1 Tax=[Clostridium] aminophilum TaxID=1526 RepID=UPI003321FBB3